MGLTGQRIRHTTIIGKDVESSYIVIPSEFFNDATRVYEFFTQLVSKNIAISLFNPNSREVISNIARRSDRITARLVTKKLHSKIIEEYVLYYA